MRRAVPAAGGVFLLGLFFFACVPPRPTVKTAQTALTPTGIPSPSPAPVVANTALFYAVNPTSDPRKLLEFLNRRHDRRLTLAFPPRYFEAPGNKETVSAFRVLQSSGQIEIALTLENEPNLPLLTDFSSGFISKTRVWDVNFAWPEDAAGQIARASGPFQRRWTRLPGGMVPPYRAVNESVVKSLSRFRLSWVMGKTRNDARALYIGSTAVLFPAAAPQTASLMEGTPEWIVFTASWTATQPFAFVDGASFKDPALEVSFLESWDRACRMAAVPVTRQVGEELSIYIPDSLSLPSSEKAKAFQNDFSDWTRAPSQRDSWQALADARKAIESYKNSGRAVLTRLDAATEEMYNAESGPFLLSLGQPQVSLPTNEHLFIATLANIYRLTGTPVPSNLNRLFVQRKWQMTSAAREPNRDRPFIENGDKYVAWNDPPRDDNGEGSYRYPLGNFPTGSFDLDRFSIRWTDSYVTFTIVTAGPLPSARTQPILPLADIYLDVNRVTGAGSTDPLPQRGGIVIDREAAWEFALTVGLANAILYQPLPGREPRKISSFQTSVSGEKKSISVSIPRDLVRGDPQEWRYSVGFGALEQSRSGEDPKPLAVTPSPSVHSFGGGKIGSNPPRYIDLLSATADEQKTAIEPYKRGVKAVLPFVEAQ